MPSARGIESVTSWTTRCAASAEPVRGTTTTSRVGSSTAGSSPPRTAIARRAIEPPSAWRYSVVSSVTGSTPESIRSPSTRPGPIEGSCAASPTNTRWVPSEQAEMSASASSTSSIDASSTTTMSSSSGHSSLRAKPPSKVTPSADCRGCAPSSRWIVDAGQSHSSSSRLAARPVGAASATRLAGVLGEGNQRRDGAALAGSRTAGQHADA